MIWKDSLQSLQGSEWDELMDWKVGRRIFVRDGWDAVVLLSTSVHSSLPVLLIVPLHFSKCINVDSNNEEPTLECKEERHYSWYA